MCNPGSQEAEALCFLLFRQSTFDRQLLTFLLVNFLVSRPELSERPTFRLQVPYDHCHEQQQQ